MEQALGDKIVLAGNIIVDSVKMITRWPDKGMLVPITSVKMAVGGAVANSGIDLKTLDPSLSVGALGFAGDDSAGDFAVSFMRDHGLDVSRISRVKGVPTSFTDCMTVMGTGERTFFNMHGADSRLTPDDVDVGNLGCDLFHLGYLLLLDGLDAPDEQYGTQAARLLAKVQAAGIRTSVDIVSEQSERFARIVRPALRYCDYAVVNEVEASLATDRSKDDLEGLCRGLLDLGVSTRVVVHRPERAATMGRDGSFVEVPSLKLPADWIVGSTGAGDAFCAGMLHSFLRGVEPEKALRLASCAAAMNLAAPDSVSGAKPLAETLALETRFARR